MNMNRIGPLFFACLSAFTGVAEAQPDLRGARPAGALTVYPDDARSSLYYYGPGKIVLAAQADGKPDLHFLQMRYTGSAATADRGKTVIRSILSFHMRLPGPAAEQMKAAQAALGGTQGGVELRPLPIRRLDAALVYTTAQPGGESKTQALPPGHFEGNDTESESSASAYWRERNYTLALDDATSQIFWDAMQKGQVVLSLGYAFYAEGIPPSQPITELSGSPELVNSLRSQVETAPVPKDNAAPALVAANATAIEIDAKRWPELFQKINVDASAPPGYAALDVYCYDFNNQLRPDLAEKQVEIEAEGVGRRPVRLITTFRQDQPDLYAKGQRFPLAVRLDRPYRYRVTETDQDGNTVVSPWKTRTSWNELLDITTAPPPEPKQPKTSEDLP